MQAEPTAMILLYHGVTAVQSHGVENFSGKHIAETDFDAQMRFVAEHGTPLPLRELADIVASGGVLPRRPVAVTFDDAFQNVRDVALPILEKARVPATYFISTGFVGTDRRFWVDRVEYIFNSCRAPFVRARLGDEERLLPIGTDAQRIAAIVDIKSAMKRMPPTQRDRLLAKLEEATGIDSSAADADNYRNLSWDDVRALDRSDGGEIGGHTVNHEIMAYLDDKTLESEIRDSLGALADGVGHPIDLFSYPEGQAHHFDERVIARLKKHHVSVCPSAIHGTNPVGTDPFYLRRVMVGFMGQEFPYDWFKDV